MALALFKLPDWMAQNKGEKDWVPTSVIFKGRVACAGVAFVNLPGPNGLLQPVVLLQPSAFEDEKPDPRTLDAKHVGMSNVLGELFVLKFHLFRWAQPSSAPLARTLNANLSRSRCTFGNSSIFRNIRAWP